MQGAVAGTPGTLPTNWSVVTSATGVTREIVGTGTENGITYIDVRYFGTSTSSGTVQINPTTSTEVAALTGQTWTAAWYLTLVGGSLPSIVNWIWQERDSSGSSVISANAGSFGLPTSGALNAQRYSNTRTLSGGATVANVTARVDVSIPNATAVDFTLRIGMPQLELGAFATSVIPTTTAAATRTADVAVMQGANFSNWYNATAGTLYAEGTAANIIVGTVARVYAQANNAANTEIFSVEARSATSTRVRTFTGGVSVVASDTYSVLGNNAKLAGAYGSDGATVCADGRSPVTAASVIPAPDTLYVGINFSATAASCINGHIRRISYWPRRLANAELQGVTA
jgi:hypothetical protein